MKIAVAGTGYVGLSIAVLLAQHNSVTAVDVISAKVEQINKRISPIADAEMEEYLSTLGGLGLKERVQGWDTITRKLNAIIRKTS